MTDVLQSMKKIHVLQGEYCVVDRQDVVLSTILGSCVAACLRDPDAGVGGMNHFLLPGEDASTTSGAAERYGAHLMEILVNELLKRGARRERLEGKLFGGGRILDGLTDIGAKNAAFARDFLRNEGISLVAENLGGVSGRRLEYYPVTGRARQSLLSGAAKLTSTTRPAQRLPQSVGDIELF